VSAVLKPYLGRWQIDVNPGGLAIWSATWRSDDGRQTRVIIAYSAAELADKLYVADEEVGP
jgi:hypothetical protein